MTSSCELRKCLFYRFDETRNLWYCSDPVTWVITGTDTECCRYHPDAVEVADAIDEEAGK